MKPFVFLVGIAICSFLGIGVSEARAASTNAMNVRFNFTASIQKPEQTVTKPASTNTTYAITKVKFGDRDMLKLLAAEFNESFPEGAQLGLDIRFHFVVLDKAGNIYKDVSSNPADSSYVFAITNDASGVMAGKYTHTSNSESMTVTQTQPDFSIYYADGKGNNFHFSGLATINFNAAVTPNGTMYKKVSLLIPGCSGEGTFFNPTSFKYEKAVFKGVWGASGSNLMEN